MNAFKPSSIKIEQRTNCVRTSTKLGYEGKVLFLIVQGGNGRDLPPFSEIYYVTECHHCCYSAKKFPAEKYTYLLSFSIDF